MHFLGKIWTLDGLVLIYYLFVALVDIIVFTFEVWRWMLLLISIRSLRQSFDYFLTFILSFTHLDTTSIHFTTSRAGISFSVSNSYSNKKYAEARVGSNC